MPSFRPLPVALPLALLLAFPPAARAQAPVDLACRISDAPCTVRLAPGVARTVRIAFYPSSAVTADDAPSFPGFPVLDANLADVARGPNWIAATVTFPASFDEWGTHRVDIIRPGSEGATVRAVPIRLAPQPPADLALRFLPHDDDTLRLAPAGQPTRVRAVLTGRGLSSRLALATTLPLALDPSAPPQVTEATRAELVLVVPADRPAAPGPQLVQFTNGTAESGASVAVVVKGVAPVLEEPTADKAVPADGQPHAVDLAGRWLDPARGIVSGAHVRPGSAVVSASTARVLLNVPVAVGNAGTEVIVVNADRQEVRRRVPTVASPTGTMQVEALTQGARVVSGAPASVRVTLPAAAPAAMLFDGADADYEVRMEGLATPPRFRRLDSRTATLEGFVVTVGDDVGQDIVAVPRAVRITSRQAVARGPWEGTITVVAPPRVTARSVGPLYPGESRTIVFTGARLASAQLQQAGTLFTIGAAQPVTGGVAFAVTAAEDAPVSADTTTAAQLTLVVNGIAHETVRVPVLARPALAFVSWSSGDGRPLARWTADDREQPARVRRNGELRLAFDTHALPAGAPPVRLQVTVTPDSGSGTGLEPVEVLLVPGAPASPLTIPLKRHFPADMPVRVTVRDVKAGRADSHVLRVVATGAELWDVNVSVSALRFPVTRDANVATSTLRDATLGLTYRPNWLGGWGSLMAGISALGVTGDETRYGASGGFLFRGKLMLGGGMAFSDLPRQDEEGPPASRAYGLIGIVGASLPALWR